MTAIAIDAADAENVRSLLSGQASALVGMLHASGVLRDKVLRSLSAAEVDAVCASKARAAALRGGVLLTDRVQPCSLVVDGGVAPNRLVARRIMVQSNRGRCSHRITSRLRGHRIAGALRWVARGEQRRWMRLLQKAHRR